MVLLIFVVAGNCCKIHHNWSTELAENRLRENPATLGGVNWAMAGFLKIDLVLIFNSMGLLIHFTTTVKQNRIPLSIHSEREKGRESWEQMRMK